jgi:hypothetical protein
MRNIPTDIYIENGAVKNHGGEIAELGKKAMIAPLTAIFKPWHYRTYVL